MIYGLKCIGYIQRHIFTKLHTLLYEYYDTNGPGWMKSIGDAISIVGSNMTQLLVATLSSYIGINKYIGTMYCKHLILISRKISCCFGELR